jgi:metal-dependent amidase/aminoacylase/carboxypeptidase family protein
MFRADIDALEMDEENFDLPYRSTIKCAHMCGHDGHTVCLLGFSALLMENIKNVPSNKTLRLLFQPCEEGSPNLEWGAPEIIKEGWLDGVDEIYGFHNLPTHHLPGKLYVKSGPVMASITVISIKVYLNNIIR